MSFVSHLQYTSCTEDLDSELFALSLNQNDRVLAIAGGGGRALGLLLHDPAEVVAIDYNEHQVHLLELKKTALLWLSWTEFCHFLGLGGTREYRKFLWEKIKPNLPPETIKYFKKRQNLIFKGLLYAGRTEKHFVFTARILRLIFRRQVARLFSFTTLDEQRKYWHSLKKNRLWVFLLKLGSSPNVFKLYIKNIGWYKYVPPGVNVPEFVFQRIDEYFNRYLARESHLVQLVFLGKYLEGGLPPHYLRKDNFEIIKARLHNLKIIQGNILDIIANNPDGYFTKYSLSNVPAYLSTQEYERLWRVLLEKSKKGSRLVYRDFLFSRKIPACVPANVINRLTGMEREANKLDKSLVFNFVIVEL